MRESKPLVTMFPNFQNQKWVEFMLSIFKNNETGFVHAQTLEPTYWAPEKFKARYEQTEKETRQELKIEARAIEDGLKRIPKNDDSEWSQTEQSIQTKCRNALTAEIDTLTKEIDLYEREIDVAGGLTMVSKHVIDNFFDNNISSLQDKVNNELSAIGGEVGSKFKKKFEERDKCQRELTAFKIKHRREEEANYPDSIFWHVLVIIVIFLAEIAFNSTFFGQGNELGLLGGIVEASGFALANVLLAVGVAWCLRHFFHVWTTHRILIGYFGTAILLGVMLGVACLAALYRFMAANAQEVEAIGLSFLPWNQLGEAINSKDGIVLILVSIIFGAIVIIDFFKLDDTYAGYGRRDRKEKKAQDWIENHKPLVANQIHATYLKNMIEKEIPEKEERFKKVLTRCENIFRLTRDYDQAVVQQLTQTYHKLLKEYRDVNMRVRNEDTHAIDQPPLHFSHYPTLDSTSFDAKSKAQEMQGKLGTVKQGYEYFLSRKQESETDQYSIKLKSIVLNNFDKLISEIEIIARQSSATQT